MAVEGLRRTDYWNRITGSVRSGDTRHDESVTDVEDFLLPYSQAATAGLHLWGVADGLAISASANSSGLSISPGAAIDAGGHLIVLAGGGLAVTDPGIDPADVANIPTVAVDAAGVSLPTTGHSGSRYLTVRYLEVSVEGLLGNAPALVHAPWVRLRDTAGFADDGAEVVLGQVSLDNGAVTALSGERRRLAGLPAGRLQLRRPATVNDAGLRVEHTPTAELRARPDGGIDFDLLSPDNPARTAFALDSAGNIGVGLDAEPASRRLHVEASEIHSGGTEGGYSFADRATESFVEDPDEGQRWLWYAQDGTARLWSGTDLFSVAPSGNIGIGISARDAQRPLHVEGHEIHSGGAFGGFSFADRTSGSFVESPAAGQRWVWYAQGGIARLWSGADQLSIALTPTPDGPGLDVHRRMRVRQGGDWSAGIWFHQNGPQNDRAFVGMADDNQVGFWGNTGAQWGVTMHTTTGELNARRGLTATNSSGYGVRATGNVAMLAEGPIGMVAASTTGGFAGLFNGDVRVTGRLTKGSLQFEIDHPLDPENKFLRHSGIESDEMKNIYDGVAQLDSQGRAEVVLPDWFEALNENFRYQLTAIGAAAPALHIARQLQEGRFTIEGGQPDAQVCWQVSGVRHDAYATAHPLQVESEKSQDEAGLFLHPEEHDAPAERSLATLITTPAE